MNIKKIIINEIFKYALNEDFKSKREQYIKQGYTSNIVDKYINNFKTIKDKKYKQLYDNINGINIPTNRRNDIDAYNDFKDLEVVVDYVMGQVDVKGVTLGDDIEIEGKPIFENEIFQIYYADSPKACIKYKGNIPYGWCISRSDSSNMYNTYRFREHEPTFYFVKVKDRTKKEFNAWNIMKTTFSGSFKDKYHFFVV